MESAALTTQLMAHLRAFVVFGLFSLGTTLWAWRWNFFFLPNGLRPMIDLTLKSVLLGFGLFLLMEVIVIPLLWSLGWMMYYGKEVVGASPLLGPTQKGWLTFFVTLGGFAGIWTAYFQLPTRQRKLIWNHHKDWLKQLGFGALSWLICYPAVIAIAQLLAIGVLWIFQVPPVDQMAVKHVKMVQSNPLLFILSVFSIAILVPITEEMLFRGLLQSWLRTKFQNNLIAIILTSLLFAFFHYSPQQGVTNIELLISLFLLSCFLGFLYERQQSLWAPIGLHAFFNGISLLMIAFNVSAN